MTDVDDRGTTPAPASASGGAAPGAGRAGPAVTPSAQHRHGSATTAAAGTAGTDPLAARAGEIGTPSVLCLQLHVHGDGLGALDLLSGEPRAFTDASEHVGLLLAAHTAVAVADAQKKEDLTRGLLHWDVIGQAKGVLVERHKLTPDQAFEVLARLSQDLNRKLYDVAADLTATGELPSRPASRTRPRQELAAPAPPRRTPSPPRASRR